MQSNRPWDERVDLFVNVYFCRAANADLLVGRGSRLDGSDLLASDYADRVVLRDDIDAFGDAAGGEASDVRLVRIDLAESFAASALSVVVCDGLPVGDRLGLVLRGCDERGYDGRNGGLRSNGVTAVGRDGVANRIVMSLVFAVRCFR